MKYLFTHAKKGDDADRNNAAIALLKTRVGKDRVTYLTGAEWEAVRTAEGSWEAMARWAADHHAGVFVVLPDDLSIGRGLYDILRFTLGQKNAAGKKKPVGVIFPERKRISKISHMVQFPGKRNFVRCARVVLKEE